MKSYWLKTSRPIQIMAKMFPILNKDMFLSWDQTFSYLRDKQANHLTIDFSLDFWFHYNKRFLKSTKLSIFLLMNEINVAITAAAVGALNIALIEEKEDFIDSWTLLRDRSVDVPPVYSLLVTYFLKRVFYGKSRDFFCLPTGL
jgi:hypothetical protein